VDWTVLDVCLLFVVSEGLRGFPIGVTGSMLVAPGLAVVRDRNLVVVFMSSVEGRVCRGTAALVELRRLPKVSWEAMVDGSNFQRVREVWKRYLACDR
jgi:hypothetical protein